jgi:hypothetical protein
MKFRRIRGRVVPITEKDVQRWDDQRKALMAAAGSASASGGAAYAGVRGVARQAHMQGARFERASEWLRKKSPRPQGPVQPFRFAPGAKIPMHIRVINSAEHMNYQDAYRVYQSKLSRHVAQRMKASHFSRIGRAYSALSKSVKGFALPIAAGMGAISGIATYFGTRTAQRKEVRQ